MKLEEPLSHIPRGREAPSREYIAVQRKEALQIKKSTKNTVTVQRNTLNQAQ